MMRHGATPGNEERRYVGRRTDEPLSDVGRAQCKQARVPTSETARVVYASPLLRARQTAEICFPQARVVTVVGLEEFDFGLFEGRTARQMEHDAHYRMWVEGGCRGACPNGESLESFCARSNATLAVLLRREGARGTREVVVVAHGGTIMAAFDAFAAYEGNGQDPFRWHVGNCQGYVANVVTCGQGLLFEDVRAFGG